MKAFEFGGQAFAAGTTSSIDLEVSVLANSTRLHLPVQVIHGVKPGPVFFMSGAIHGDEIQGVEIIRQVLLALNAGRLAGTVLAVPIVNSFVSSNGDFKKLIKSIATSDAFRYRQGV